MRKWILIALGVLVLGVAIFVGAVAWAFRDRGPPPVLGAVQCKERDCTEDHDFAATLEKRFPGGISASSMERLLTQQGFIRAESPSKCTPDGAPEKAGEWIVPCPVWDSHWDPRNRLLYSWGSIACNNVVGISWSPDKYGRIAHRQAFAYYACL